MLGDFAPPLAKVEIIIIGRSAAGSTPMLAARTTGSYVKERAAD